METVLKSAPSMQGISSWLVPILSLYPSAGLAISWWQWHVSYQWVSWLWACCHISFAIKRVLMLCDVWGCVGHKKVDHILWSPQITGLAEALWTRKANVDQNIVNFVQVNCCHFCHGRVSYTPTSGCLVSLEGIAMLKPVLSCVVGRLHSAWQYHT